MINVSRGTIFSIALAVLVNNAPAFAAEFSNVNPTHYVHVRFKPESIQDLPARLKGSAPPRPIPIGRTQFKLNLDIYFIPETGEGRPSPVFVIGSFNARRDNHQWLTIDLHHQIDDIVTSENYNKAHTIAVATAVAAQDTWSPGLNLEPTFIPFDLLQAVLVLTDKRPQFSELGSGHQDPHLTMALAIPVEDFIAPEEPFRMEVHLLYGVLNFSELSQTVRHKKFFKGIAEVIPMTEQDHLKLKELIELSSCDQKLGSKTQ